MPIYLDNIMIIPLMNNLSILKPYKRIPSILDLYYEEYRDPMKIPVENIFSRDSLLNFEYFWVQSLSKIHVTLNLKSVAWATPTICWSQPMHNPVKPQKNRN